MILVHDTMGRFHTSFSLKYSIIYRAEKGSRCSHNILQVGSREVDTMLRQNMLQEALKTDGLVWFGVFFFSYKHVLFSVIRLIFEGKKII